MLQERKLYVCKETFRTQFEKGGEKGKLYGCEQSRNGLFYFIYKGASFYMTLYKGRFEKYFEEVKG